MEPPKITGITIRSEIGRGSTGVVYAAVRDDGTHCVVKVLDSMASNVGLLESRITRLRSGEAQDVTVPVMAYALDVRPACVVMPQMAERLGEVNGLERYRPRTLQIHYGDYSKTAKTWPFLLKLANRLAILHKAKVAHGNLKPGNIFLGPNGGPLLADYASGLMPGVHHLAYSDALLYAPPEQLLNPEGYLEEEGYQWDVFAFGVLAYRLLTGNFPRCHETLSPFSPTPGTEERFQIEADRESIAAWLETDPDIVWPDAPKDERDSRRREMINFCLGLDAMGRPSDMREVARYFETIERDFEIEAEAQRLIEDRQTAHKRRRKIRSFASVLTVIAIGLGTMWGITVQKNRVISEKKAAEFANYREEATSTIGGLEEAKDEMQSSLDDALKREMNLQASLAGEKEQSQSEIVSAQSTNELLFRWMLEKGASGYPALEGRKVRLETLTDQVRDQLEGMESRPELEGQVALLRLRLAELILAAGDSENGESSLKDALTGEGLSPEDAARAQLRLLLLETSQGKGDLHARIEQVAAEVEKAWSGDEAKKLRAEAALELIRARNAENSNEGTKAMAFYQEGLKRFRELSDTYPENPVLSLTLGRAYLSAARAADGEGAIEDSAKLRGEATAEFIKLAAKQESPDPELEFHIASATAAQAISLWQQGQSFEAEKLAKEGVIKLEELLGKMPDDPRIIVNLASQHGILATFLRDEGKTTEAGSKLEQAISALAAVIQKSPKNWDARYLMASLKWQLAGILGQKGEKESELKIGIEARDELKLILESDAKRPHPAIVRKSLAYLCGDLGHSADLAGHKDQAVEFLKESQECWKQLSKDQGDEEEYREGLQWASDRLIELGAK